MVSSPIATRTPPDNAEPSGTARRQRPGPTRSVRVVSAPAPQSRRSQTSARTLSGATMPNTYATPMASAAGNEDAAPDTATTPASTGAQQALATPENRPSEYTDTTPPPDRPRRPTIGNENFHPVSIAAPKATIATPPREKTSACWPEISRLSRLAPSAIGRITVPSPAAKTSVIPTIRARRWKVEAKYAGSITDTQQGASSATPPPRNDAKIVVDNNNSRTAAPLIGPNQAST